jgi:dihydrofolate reductase
MTVAITIVVAMAENGVIGDSNRLPWHLPADLKHFKALTIGKPIAMGRKTFQSIGKPLPERRNLVLTRDRSFSAPGVETVASFEDALILTASSPELMVIGGAEIFRLALPKAQRMHLTRVHAHIPGDVYFPAFNAAEWRELERRAYPADSQNAHAMTFCSLERIKSRE